MKTVFIVMADSWEYCTKQWVCGVFSTKQAAEDHRNKAQLRADAVYEKIRALGEEDGIPATWRSALQELKREAFPEDPNAYLGWDGTMHYTVQEWSVDEHSHDDFPKIYF